MNDEKNKRTRRPHPTRVERMEHAASLKKGKCFELFRPITQCTPADLGLTEINFPVQLNEIMSLTVGDLCDRLGIAPGELMFKLVSHTEGIRNMSQVRDVMIEGDILNGVIPARCSPMVERVVTKSIGFRTEGK